MKPQAVPAEYRRVVSAVNSALTRECDRLLASGSELGLSVSVYLRGHEIARVCGGVYRPRGSRGWRAVGPDTLFMGYSVAKGVAATALLAISDRGLLEYSAPVTRYWPDFDSTGDKGDVSVEQALSHRAGLTGASVGFLWFALKYFANRCLGWDEWRCGEHYIEGYRPDWTPGTKAVYHPVSFSFISGGIARHALKAGEEKGAGTAGLDKRRAVDKSAAINQCLHEWVCEPLGIQPDDLTIGELSSAATDRVASLEMPRGLFSERSWSVSWLGRAAVGVVESVFFTWIGNLDIWRSICLPSSNAIWTPSALARMYAAVCNRGAVGKQRVLRPETVRSLWTKLHSPKAPGGFLMPGDGRLALGFSPWTDSKIHGPEALHERVVGHKGIGGCLAFGELREEGTARASATSGLAIAIGKNVYYPVSLTGPGPAPTVATIVGSVRAAVQECDGARVLQRDDEKA